MTSVEYGVRQARHRRWLACASVVAAAALSLSACGGSDGGSDGGSAKPVVVRITEHGGSVSASSDLVEARVGQKIVFKVTTDSADEIHVHSVPDHEFEISPGPVESFAFSVQTPGTVEVESHGLDTTVLKLEVH